MRTLTILMGAAALAAAALVGAGSPASAVGPTCTLSSTITYSPGLQITPMTQTRTFTVGFGNCVTPGRPDITSGSRGRTLTGVRGCLDPLPSSFNSVFTVTWNTGETSNVSTTTTTSNVAGQTVIVQTGTVTGGLFSGSSYNEVIAQANLDLLACLTPPGVQSQSGLGTVTVL